ncbi:hypothetical protein GCM10023085_40570 [Actinomadura viridis]
MLMAPWPDCAVSGCAERSFAPYPGCLGHLTPDELADLMAGLRPGADLDLRGVTVPERVLTTLLEAVTGPDGHPHLGRSRFEGAVLPPCASLSRACFEGDCSFDGARFAGAVSFFAARFLGNVSFRGVRFGGNASFHGARFRRHAAFDEAVFAGDALFGETAWGADASFTRAVFAGAAAFDRARFGRDAVLQATRFGGDVSFRRVQVTRHARFERARFRRDLWLGPMAAGGRLVLTHATAHGGLRVDAAARHLAANRTVVRGPADFRLRHAELDLEDSVFGADVTVRSLSRPFQHLTEPGTAPGTARVLSLSGTSAPRLELAGMDLSRCRFSGLVHPGGLRLTGHCSFATVPRRPRRRPRWRARTPTPSRPGRRVRGRTVLAEELAGSRQGLQTLYEQLAAAAADRELARDFRYRAREIRRRDDPRARNRWLLHLSWLTCGHGLRTGRMLACLAVLMVLVAAGATWARHGQHTSAPVRLRPYQPAPADATYAPRP